VVLLPVRLDMYIKYQYNRNYGSKKIYKFFSLSIQIYDKIFIDLLLSIHIYIYYNYEYNLT